MSHKESATVAETPYMTLGQVATRLKCQSWQVARLYLRGLLPPAARLGRTRVVTEADLPAIERALRKAGYITGGQQSQQASGVA
jgi:hypothetical protein